MLESMRRIFDRIDELNQGFRGMSPRHSRRAKQTFADAMNEAQKMPILTTKNDPVPSVVPMPGVAPATKAPPDFSSMIKTYATKYKIDPELVRKVIEVESGFDPKSVSKKGAMGLMQLMPDTARELGVTNPFDPEENIEGGTRYLSQLMNKNGGDLARALASYNAGPGAVRQYGGIPPFPETQNYVRKIMSALGKDSNTEEE